MISTTLRPRSRRRHRPGWRQPRLIWVEAASPPSSIEMEPIGLEMAVARLRDGERPSGLMAEESSWHALLAQLPHPERLAEACRVLLVRDEVAPATATDASERALVVDRPASWPAFARMVAWLAGDAAQFGPMSTERMRATVEDLLRAELGDELGGLSQLLAPDFVEDYPQSRERVTGPEGVRRLLMAHPSRPRRSGTPRITVLGEEQVAFEVPARYGDEPWWMVGVLELRDGLVHRERAYFASLMAPAAWRADWVVPLPSADDAGEVGAHQAVDRSVVERYFRAQSEADLPTLTHMRHGEWVHDMPQASERFPTPESFVRAHAQYPGGLPALTPLHLSGPDDQWVIGAGATPMRVSGHGAHWVGEAELTYPNGERWFDILFMDFRDGKVVAERSYWCLPFDAPEWRRELAERY